MRIVITGLGLVGGLGASADEVFSRMLRGESAVAPVTLFDTSGQRCKLGAQIPGLDVEAVAPRGQAGRWSRADAAALLAASEALRQAGLDPRRDEVALALGGTTAGMFEAEGLLASMARDPSRCAPDDRLASIPLSSTLDRLREALGPFRRARALCSACSAGSYAVALGAGWLRLGRARRALVGASEGLCRMVFAGFDSLMITDPDGCRPFDRRRRGINLGEGAAFLVLETEESARERGRPELAELAGWALGAEAFHITQPEADGATVASLIALALARAGADPREVDLVSAHGTGTPRNDAAEAAALRAALGLSPRVSSHKGHLGHTLGAAGVVGAALSVLAMRDGVAPPTFGLAEPDPACELRHVASPEPCSPRLALVNAFGFGGLDAVLALRAPGAAPSRPPAWPRPAAVVLTAAASVDPAGVRAHDAPPPGEPPRGRALWEPGSSLDPDRTRRLDRSSLAVIAACKVALEAGALEARGRLVGAVVGTMAGAIFTCAEHCARSEDAGGRCLNPILFPNLVSSSPAANAAIYLGLRGPVLSVVDQGTSGECAALTAIDLLAAGEADAVCAGSYDELSPLTALAFDPLLAGLSPGATDAEGASALLLEREDIARERGARLLGRVLFFDEGAAAPAPPPPAGRGAVFVARPGPELAALLGAWGWAGAPVRAASQAHGVHEAAGGQALSLAAGALGRGEIEQALVVGRGPGRWVVLVLGA